MKPEDGEYEDEEGDDEAGHDDEPLQPVVLQLLQEAAGGLVCVQKRPALNSTKDCAKKIPLLF